ncbi:molecular chaperone DnaJ [Campylobacter sp. FMV-PI01]|uniref:Chaperone protein DnaJ n=1 Tax=Campylobacter portucalensis TaxID=2608384 RepID=A0A6L5WJ84_9BACT|nr:molecular chaperone DnaJ [Campylobacter portucalensis]MSN95791.1 molecular chaperone DnaJ [Campylobacter portucalensis]
MSELDYYEILEISKDADSNTIKKAFRKLALKYHPDRNQGNLEAERKFKEINEAYQCLGDEEKRKIYDRYGKAGLGSSSGFRGFEDFSDIFESFFGDGFSRSTKKRVDNYVLDVEINLRVDFKDAVFGTQKELKYKIKKPCKTCDGNGGKKNTCKTCGGSGKFTQTRGFMSFVSTCPHCNGIGEIIVEKCKKCSGLGYEEEEICFKFDVPKGVDNGMKIRISQKGNLSKSGEYGDLYVNITVKEDDKFIRHGDDVYIEIPIFVTQAMLGENILIPTLRGEKNLKLHIGTKDKEQFILENEGIENIRTKEIGKLIAQISIKMPTKLNDEQIKMIQNLQESFGVKTNEIAETSLFEKIKGWFK